MVAARATGLVAARAGAMVALARPMVNSGGGDRDRERRVDVGERRPGLGEEMTALR